MDAFFMRGDSKMSGKIMGYARVSSTSQNLGRQLAELEKYVEKSNIVVDKASGKDLNRNGFQALKGPLGLRKGDTLIIKSLDRLSRNKTDIKNELEWFKENQINLQILDLPTTMIQLPNGQEWIRDMINNIIIEVMSSIAEQERIAIRQRQREGIDVAQRQGKHMGRPKLEIPAEWDKYYVMWKDGKITAKKVMEILDLKRTSFYNLVHSMK